MATNLALQNKLALNPTCPETSRPAAKTTRPAPIPQVSWWEKTDAKTSRSQRALEVLSLDLLVGSMKRI